MKNWKNNLDERQEQTLKEIESRGFWLAFFGLFAALVVEQIVYGWEFEQKAGELIVFLALAVYIMYGCLKNGIWDRHLKPNPKTNLLVSLTAGLAVAVINFFSIWGKFPDKLMGCLAGALVTAVMTFVMCFAALSLAAAATKKRQKELEKEPEE